MNLQEIRVGARVAVVVGELVNRRAHLGPGVKIFDLAIYKNSLRPATVTGIGDSSGDDGCDTPIYVEIDGHGPSAFPASAIRPIGIIASGGERRYYYSDSRHSRARPISRPP